MLAIFLFMYFPVAHCTVYTPYSPCMSTPLEGYISARHKTILCVRWDNVGSKIGGLPKTVLRATVFFAFRPEISELPQPIGVKLCQMMGNGSSVKNLNPKIYVPLEKNVQGSKNFKIGAKFREWAKITLGPVGINSPNLCTWCEWLRLWSRISPERIAISKVGKATATPATFREKNGELWSTNKKVIGAHVDPLKINTARAVD